MSNCIRVGKSRGIVIGRDETNQDHLTLRDRRPVDRHVRGSKAWQANFHWPAIAQDLLDRVLGHLRVILDHRQLVGVGQQGERAAGDEVNGGHVTGGEQDEDHRQQLFLVERIAILFGVNELADQVIGRRRRRRSKRSVR